VAIVLIGVGLLNACIGFVLIGVNDAHHQRLAQAFLALAFLVLDGFFFLRATAMPAEPRRSSRADTAAKAGVIFGIAATLSVVFLGVIQLEGPLELVARVLLLISAIGMAVCVSPAVGPKPS
jgi:NADH:ubiquinone oxidoreductase subunit 2 (subunit N)